MKAQPENPTEKPEYRPFIWKAEIDDFAESHVWVFREFEKDKALKFVAMCETGMINKSIPFLNLAYQMSVKDLKRRKVFN
ncbi:MAG TPA: hypothetical protein VF692_13695 [Pyrinomonadaceae bacterium]|jgi:hypothetical protein